MTRWIAFEISEISKNAKKLNFESRFLDNHYEVTISFIWRWKVLTRAILASSG